MRNIRLLIFLFLIQGCHNPKYELEFAEDEYRGIREISSGMLAVEPAVIGFESSNGHFFGYRLPKQDVICDWNQSGRDINIRLPMLDLKPVFFSLNLEDGTLKEFTNRSEFEKFLQSVGIDIRGKFTDIENSRFVLHYKKLYRDYDYSKCSPAND